MLPLFVFMGNSISDRRVVITGIGTVASLGHDIDTFWDNLVAGKCGVAPITQFDATDYDCKIAAEVSDFDPLPAFPNAKEIRRTDRFVQLGVYAGWKALLDSGMDLEKVDRDEIGVFIGSGIGGLKTTEEQHTILKDRGPDRVSPFMIPMLILNMASGMFSMYYNLRGPNVATCSACATSGHAIGEAWRNIKMGAANAIFAGGSEATVVTLGIGGFAKMRALSTRNDEPEKASRPFDKDRDGFVMGEGSAVIVLEELEHAKARGAKIYAELVGYGNTADAHHLTSPAPHGEGAVRCMKMALKSAGMTVADIDYVNAHGTSTPQGDIAETEAIKTVFGEDAKRIAVSSTKGATGHMLGAAGSIELAICAKAIQTETIPPTINLDNPDPECDLDYVPHTARKTPVRAALSNSFGFGGHNASLIVKKFEE